MVGNNRDLIIVILILILYLLFQFFVSKTKHGVKLHTVVGGFDSLPLNIEISEIYGYAQMGGASNCLMSIKL